MADTDKPAPDAKPAVKTDKVIVINRGRRSYRTSVGLLEPGKSISLPADEAAKLLDHTDVVDASKAVPQAGSQINFLKAENSALKEENARLKSQIPKDTGKKDDGKSDKKG